MNLMITGGAGFIGSRFAEMLVTGYLSHQYSKIVVVDKLTYSGNSKNLELIKPYPNFFFHHVDICDYKSIEELILKYSINSIVNFAAESHVDKSIVSPVEFVRTNILGTQTLLDLTVKYSIGRFLQISTDEVYGSIESGSWEEEESIKPNSPYSASKGSADLLVLAYGKTYGINVGITRCCNNYGPRQYPEKAIPLFITNLIEGKAIPIYGTGNQIREWIHVDDHCRGILNVLENGSRNGVYNVAGMNELTNRDLAMKLLAFFDKDPAHFLKFVEDRKAHDFRYSLSGTKIFKELGFEPKIVFDEGLNSTIEWYVANESWWRPLKLIL